MDYQTPADRVEADRTGFRASKGWVLLAFLIASIGFCLAWLGWSLGSHALQFIGFTVGAGGVLVGVAGVGRAWLALFESLLRRKP